MKKILSVVLSFAMVLSLAACGSSGGNSANNNEAPNSQAEAGGSEQKAGGKGRIAYIVGNLGDKSFSDSGQAGIEILKGEGWDCKTIETGGEAQADKWENYILDAIDEGYEYIVASATYSDICYKLAEEFPDVHFVVFDEYKDEAEIADNVAVIFYAQNEGSYLVGMVAAAMSTSKVVAVNVGIDNPVIADFVTGYVEGVKAYDPQVKVVKASVGSWTDPAKMKEICLAQARDQKADVFYQVAGGSGTGLFEACKSNSTWAIGVDSDQYAYYKDSENPELADAILTSMLKEVGDSLVSFFHDVEAGKDVWKKMNTLGLSQNSVGYVNNDFYKQNVPEDVQKKVEAAAQDIKDGKITVKSYYDFADEAEYQALLDSVAP